jgi:uncharacterized protein
MELEWDEAKRQDALRERGLDFADVVRFRFELQYTIQDNRTEYGEPRFFSTGYLGGRLCVLCWTLRDDKMRIISLRKANEREQKKYRDTAG